CAPAGALMKNIMASSARTALRPQFRQYTRVEALTVGVMLAISVSRNSQPDCAPAQPSTVRPHCGAVWPPANRIIAIRSRHQPESVLAEVIDRLNRAVDERS